MVVITPYRDLAHARRKPAGWLPPWAIRRSVHRTGATTTYVVEPSYLDTLSVAELHQLSDLGWTIHIDAARLGLIRINITKTLERTELS